MKAFIRLSIVSVVFINLLSCVYQKPISKITATNNKTYLVEYLFEHEGCKVYRFSDNGHYVYYTNCNGNVTSIENDSLSTRVENSIRNIKK